jgi:hypothetical protein
MLKREEGMAKQIDRSALCMDDCSDFTSTHTGGNRSLFTRLRLSSETASDDPETVRRFRHRDHTSADGPASKSPLRMNRFYTKRTYWRPRSQTPITVPYSLQRRPPGRTATPSHAKYLSENLETPKVLFVFGRKPRVLRTTPTLQRPSEDDHQGYRRRLDTVFTQAHHHLLYLSTNDPELQSILHAPR